MDDIANWQLHQARPVMPGAYLSNFGGSSAGQFESHVIHAIVDKSMDVWAC